MTRGAGFHWVGDGFYVTQVIPGPYDLTRAADPFLMMDYHAPYHYAPTDTPRGVGVHPHRGFETVTLAFEGSVAHHDSTGAGGVIHPGDVQWMTAASGVLHQEYHEAEWARRGGTFHMMQLWVNLPAAHKMDPPRYQALTADRMGRVDLPGGGVVTLVAGSLGDATGPAQTVTPIELWDVRLTPSETAELAVPVSHHAMVFVLDGQVTAAGSTIAAQHLALFDHDGAALVLTAGGEGCRFVVLAGEPIDEPIASYGPFVMNTRDELIQAVDDFNAGRFGRIG